jgi:hypothetical protein
MQRQATPRPGKAPTTGRPQPPTAQPSLAPATGWASPIAKLTVVFVVFIVGQIAIRLPSVDHSGLYRGLCVRSCPATASRVSPQLSCVCDGCRYPPSDSDRNMTKAAAVNVVLPRNASVFLRSPAGLSVHSYGSTILSQLPEDSLLLSHTDLTWNSVRYLQVGRWCSCIG